MVNVLNQSKPGAKKRQRFWQSCLQKSHLFKKNSRGEAHIRSPWASMQDRLDLVLRQLIQYMVNVLLDWARKCLRAKYTTHSSSTPMRSSLRSYTLSCASILPLLTKRKASVNITSWLGGKVIPKEYYNSGKPRLPLTCFGTSLESKSKVLMKWGVVGWLQLPL